MLILISGLFSNDQHIISPNKINSLSKQAADEKKEFNMHLLVFVIPGVLEEGLEDYTRRKQSLSKCCMMSIYYIQLKKCHYFVAAFSWWSGFWSVDNVQNWL